MAASLNRYPSFAAILLHSFILLGSSIYALHSKHEIALTVENVNDNLMDVSAFISHRRHRRSLFDYHHRAKRQVAVTNSMELPAKTVNENFTGFIFNLGSHFTEPQSYVIESSTADLFEVNGLGDIGLKQNATLDYEEVSHRSITLQVLATNRNNVSAVTRVTLRISVQNINDEPPVFKNRPFPYLETIAPNAQADEEVYELYAEDPDPGSVVEYKLLSGSDGRFKIQTQTKFVQRLGTNIRVGIIQTAGAGRFEEGREFTLLVMATDTAAPTNQQQSTSATVMVKVGTRVPQFFESTFRATVRENNNVDQSLNGEFKIEAKSFQDRSLSYSLRTATNGTSSEFSIESDGTVKVMQKLDYEDPNLPQECHCFELNVLATESVTNLQSMSKLFVEVLDDNDNSPIFEVPTYHTVHPENISLNSTVVTVKALDADSGINAELEYSVDNDHFYVETVATKLPHGPTEYTGYIKVKKHLDFDELDGHAYRFTVTATDKGSPENTGTASVRIFVTNVNDEAPEFILAGQKTDLREDAEVGRTVKVVQAVDIDKDQIQFYFTPRLTYYKIFEIVPTSGLIRLSQSVPDNVDEYVLNITAYDDGSCCPGNTILSSEAYFNIEIVDINTDKPSFPDCSSYNNNATILEGMPATTPVIKIKAVDGDRGENGRVTYDILRSPTQPTRYFDIDKDSGQVTSAFQFDRERLSFYTLTIRGRDQGNPRLEGYCTFRINVGDTNDNAPVFDLPNYQMTISESYEPGRSIITVRANDNDLGQNAEIEYIMVNSANGKFRVDSDAGIVYLNQTLGSISKYDLKVMARDKGVPPLNTTVDVTVELFNVTSKPPTWDDPSYENVPFIVKESASRGSVIKTFHATSNVDATTMTFNLLDSNGKPTLTVSPFRIQPGPTSVNLTVFNVLDFNKQNKYELRLKVSNHGTNPASSMIKPVIQLEDTNDKIPYFLGLASTGFYPGSLPENAPPGQTVIEVKAYDDDPKSPNNKLSFQIIDKPETRGKFYIETIDANTAVLKSNASFDRENKSQLFLEVQVQDGTASSRPNHHPPGSPNTARATVQIRITDMNDNPPKFRKDFYNTTVREDVPLRQSVIRVQADDEDDAAVLTYSIIRGNPSGLFGVYPKTGDIYVSRELDYETQSHTHDLTVQVYDGIYNSSTLVQLHVLDANDNSPVFENETYIIRNVVEETLNGNRQFLLQVRATDQDVDRNTQIQYSLLLPDDIQNYFEIERDTGRLYLLQPLDRDRPRGRPSYQFNIQAQDEPTPPAGSGDLDQPNVGYASVEVKPIDINDNSPIFSSSLKGSVLEHSPAGTSVMTVIAFDYDEGDNAKISYQLFEGPSDENSQEMKFRINQNTGLILTNVNGSALDREKHATHRIRVRATDHGSPDVRSTVVNVTIDLIDINDQSPVFHEKLYRVNMSEALSIGQVAIVGASDGDIGDNARLDYSLVSPTGHFEVQAVNNEGIIVVRPNMGPDYDAGERFFNLTVVVTDPDPTHRDTANVLVTVFDFNDNAPEFKDKTISVQKLENEPVGTFLAKFSATDKDETINAEFTYYIDRFTDPDRLFTIDQQGNVSIKNSLDREKQEEHKVSILAIDHGSPALTGTATMILTVLDINDNFPQFAKDYHPIVMEDDSDIGKVIQEIMAIDRDNDPFGAPFGFKDPECPNGPNTCPCPTRPTCNDFALAFKPNGDSGKGSADVSTKRIFDRERQKYYYMPVVMWDMRGKGDGDSQTGTNTLTIEIGDINDNKHKPGHQDIFVYNYEDLFGPLVIGRVYATDPDDWDLADKTFTYKGSDLMGKYFQVDFETGMITMAKGVPGASAPYTFQVDVYDRHFGNTEKCTVAVTIRDITEEAVFRSGSVRLKGITAEEFVKRPKTPGDDITAYSKSKYEQFRDFVADKLKIPVGNVDVLSVQNKEEFTDVRFSAHSSPYYPAHEMNAVAAIHKDALETELNTQQNGDNRKFNIQIDQVPIDECVDEKFEGGCYNFLNVTGQPAMVNTNGTSFVGVQMFTQPMEGCRSHFYPPVDECTADYCYNGGVCVKDDWGELSCHSCPSGFNGPRCQSTHHSFDGASYALYDPLEQCLESRTSLHFMTEERSGIIMYNGPVSNRDPESNDPTDFILLELFEGYPKLTIDHGSGTLPLYIDGRDEHLVARIQEVSDGKWHRIDIIRHGQQVTMILDNCDAWLESDQKGDDRICRKSGSTPDENVFLNVNTPLQLGGRFPAPNYPAGNNFDGCIKELKHNGRLYDLHIKEGNYPSGENTCGREDLICNGKCGDNGVCVASTQSSSQDAICVCKPGFMGNLCSFNATMKDLRTKSFFQWRIKDHIFNKISSHKLKMSMMFRTRQPDGALWTMSSSDKKTLQLLIKDGLVTLQYSNEKDTRYLQLYHRPANNGRWHTVTVSRHGREFTLEMDNGEGPNYNYSLGVPGDDEKMHLSNQVYGGADVTFTEVHVALLNWDLVDSCMRDVRMDYKWFALDDNEGMQDYFVANLSKAQNVEDGCVRDDCKDVVCNGDRICYPLWGTYECRCKEHFEDVNGVCEKIDYCKDHKCFGDAKCEEDYNQKKNYKCVCPPGWGAEYCDQILAGPLVAGLTAGSIIAIIVSIFVLLVLSVAIILLVTCGKKQRPDDKYILEVDPDDDIRENVINYDEEGAGEEDQDAYDINRLRKPDSELHKPPIDFMPRREVPRLRNAPGESPDVGNFIEDRLGDADDDNDAPPHDAVREFVYEGDGSDAGSLSSLQTSSSTSSQDYDYLNEWGPKFAKLADMYGAGAEEEV